MKQNERVTVLDKTINSLYEYIQTHKLVPGDQMPSEMQVVKMFNVGRSTAREAYRTLQAMGILEIQQGRGTFLRQATVTDKDDSSILKWFKDNAKRLTDYFEVRLAIETVAVRQAVNYITDQQITELRDLNKHFAQAAKEQNPVKMALYDKKFHLVIAETTANQLLIKIEELITDCITDYLAHTYMISENSQKALGSHKALVDAIAARDMKKSVELMTQHIKNSMMHHPR